MSLPAQQDGLPRLLFLNQTPRCYSRRRTVAERKVINVHVQENQHRKQRQAAIKRLRNGRWTFFTPTLQLKPAKTPHGSNRAATELEGDLVTPSTDAKSTRWSEEIKVDRDDDFAQVSSETSITKHREKNVPANEAGQQAQHYEYASARRLDEARATSTSRSISQKGGVLSFLDPTKLDPFANSAMPISKIMNYILSHFVKIIIPLVYPIELQAVSANQQILQIALANPIVLNSIIAVSSVQQQSPSKDGLPISVHARNPEYLHYKIKSISMINTAMSDPAVATTGATIMAINNVMTIETMIGNDSEVQIHIRGIERILSMRGGFEGLPIVIVELLLPCLYMSSVWTGTKPLFPPPRPPNSVSTATAALITNSLNPSLRPLCTGLFSPTVITYFSPTMVSTIRALVNFTLFREHFRTTTRGMLLPELQHITIVGLHVEYQLLALPFNETQHSVQEAVRNALLMFKNGLYGIHSPTAAINRALLACMKIALDASDLPSFWNPAQELLVWILCLGAHHSSGEKERPWFVMLITRGARILRLSTWEDLQALLRKFFYLDRIYGESMKRIWDEVALLTGYWP